MAKVGDVIKIKKLSGHSYALGTKYKIVIDAGNETYMAESLTDPPIRGNYITSNDFDIIYEKNDIIERLEKLELKNQTISRRKEYLKKNKLKKIDSKTMSIIEIMEISNSDKSETEKIKELSKLIEEYNEI